jgi:arylsulfatase A-like enzyme
VHFVPSALGYHFGHFRLPPAKMHVYEFDVRVPFLVRGPMIPRNASFAQLAGNIDLAPTFLDIAGVKGEVVDQMDGKSLLPLFLQHATRPASGIDGADGGGTDALGSDAEWRTEFMFEYYPITNWHSDSRR